MAHEAIYGRVVCRCDREKCGHVWLAKTVPLRCADCKSPYWDVARGMAGTALNKSAEAAQGVDAPSAGIPEHKGAEVGTRRPAVKKSELVGGAGMMFPKKKWQKGAK